MDGRELLTQMKRRLVEAYGSRLQNLVLYGSEARGEAHPDSDIDVLVILRGPIRLWDDLRAAVRALYPLSLLWDRPITPLPVDADEYSELDCPLYRSARKEGITL